MTPLTSQRRAIAAVLLVVAAFALQRAATSPWATFSTPDGATVQLTASGVARHTPSGVTDCRWWPTHGNTVLCGASSNEGSFGRVRWAYPLLFVALWAAIGCLFLVFLRVPRRRGVRTGLTAVTALAVLIAVLVMWYDAPRGLAALEGTSLSRWHIGAWLGWLGALTLGVSAALQATET